MATEVKTHNKRVRVQAAQIFGRPAFVFECTYSRFDRSRSCRTRTIFAYHLVSTTLPYSSLSLLFFSFGCFCLFLFSFLCKNQNSVFSMCSSAAAGAARSLLVSVRFAAIVCVEFRRWTFRSSGKMSKELYEQ